MTNNDRESALYAMGYSTREVEEQLENETPNSSGTHFANALAFIVETLGNTHNEELPVHNTDDFENALDAESLMEFADMYNFSMESFRTALDWFRVAVKTEVMNAHYNGECNNCTEHPAQFN